MNADELKRKFPRASQSFIKINFPDGNTRPIDKLEPSPRVRPLAKKKDEGSTCQRFLVRITAFRHRLLDEDNICEKYYVDLCRYAGIIPNDAPDQVSIESKQKKVRKSEKERVIIEIYDI